jgi:hypothetical protein
VKQKSALAGRRLGMTVWEGQRLTGNLMDKNFQCRKEGVLMIHVSRTNTDLTKYFPFYSADFR